MTRRTDAEVLELLRGDSPLNKARQIFSGECARIEQAEQQRQALSPIEMRRMEFEAVEKIAAALTASAVVQESEAIARENYWRKLEGRDPLSAPALQQQSGDHG